MELKTLKDLTIGNLNKLNEESRAYIDVVKLKQEAIKWVKFYGENNAFLIMDFFNITEEDLSQGMTQEVPK